MAVLMILIAFANAILSGVSTSQKRYGWAVFNGLIAIGLFMRSA